MAIGAPVPGMGDSTVLSEGGTCLEPAGAAAHLVPLLVWLSPAYPVGAFAYSHGLEWAVETGDIRDLASLEGWVGDLLEQGGPFTDAVFLAHAWRAVAARDNAALREVAELAAAFAPSRERQMETLNQGDAFLAATRVAWPAPDLDLIAEAWEGRAAYPVAVGVSAAAHGVPLGVTLGAFLTAVAANLVSAAVRLVPLGQTDGNRALAALSRRVHAIAERAAARPLAAAGGAALRSDIAAMRHETQYTRLFRS
ncbi:urease accessory protein UreF [Ancylobacter lacus]|uniref:urease accessory protein UreF n=1 Tax=Ancylobacter lacus TaxID=2579970 RepID=UPI001BD11279|nr:urease accessory protein UreF [Ancylobacter lacus]